MAAAQAMPMPTFVARCLEEIGLEGRCGLPVRDMFALVDDAGDVVYRKFAWKVLRAMGGQVAFHYMLRRPQQDDDDQEKDKDADSDCGQSGDAGVRREQRRRKWSTTLMPVDEGNADHAAKPRATPYANGYANGHLSDDQSGSRQRKRRRRRVDANGSESAEDSRDGEASGFESEAAQNEQDTATHRANGREASTGCHEAQQQRLSDRRTRSPRSRSPQRRSHSHSRSRSSGSSEVNPSARSRQTEGKSEGITPEPRDTSTSDVTVKNERSKWLYRSPRGYELGEELDVTGLSYEDAISETPEGVLGIVACEELRLKYLGVVDPSGIDTSSPQFDLLELIGRAREQGLNAALVAETGLFGDARKLHYLLDLLIACNFVVKNIVSADQKRFNILHLTRFVSLFHPSMVSPTASFEKDSFPKDQLAHMIARILRSRGERTCVFADIGRELGYDKRQQEKLRKYFFHQMHIDTGFPLELFMARCNTGSDAKGRKLWCVRLRSTGRLTDGGNGEGSGDSSSGAGPVIERGIMEQMLANIHARQDEGATIPELRDVLGVPTFKLPYKLAQGLISNYNLGVEQVVLGKSTMYRMFAPGVGKAEQEIPQLEADVNNALADDEDLRDEVDGNMTIKEVETIYQPSTLKEATRGLVVASTAERRRQYILERVTREKIVSIHQLRSGLIEIERPKGKPVPDVGLIDIRSVRRIVDELVTTNAIVTIDITLPPKRVLQKGHKMVKCVALPDAQRDREVLRAFIDGYLEEQHRKFLEGLDHENDSFIVVSNRVNKKMSKGGDTTAFMKENENKEIVKYSAASYKLARVHLVMLHKQGRRLGMYFGIMYRCKALHLLMWDRVPSIRANHASGVHENESLPSSSTQHDTRKISTDKQNLVFALKEILDVLTVREYIQLVGVSEVLVEAEENKVRMAIARGDSWDALSSEIVEKIRGCEADRFSRVLRVLIELGLVQVVNDSSLDLLSAMRRSTEDFDQVISQVAFATLSGGLFLLKSKARITLKRGSKLLKHLPNKSSYVYAAGFSGSSRGDQLTGRVPLEYAFAHIDDAKAFWKSLKFLSLEGARLGSGGQDGPGGNVNVDSELVRPAPLRDHNLYAMKVWVPRATTNYRAITERAKAAADAVGSEPDGARKRKRYQSVKAARVSGRAEKVQRRDLVQLASSAYREVEGDESGSGSGMGWRQMDGWGGAKSRIRAVKWSSEDDVVLMNHFIEKLSHQWFIDVPLALQKRDERVAFRTTNLSRTRISWKGLSARLGRKREDCMLRVRELMTVPAIQARVEKTKLAMTRAKNPGGEFHEELAVLKQPKLTALLCLALQIIFHERASYYSVLADMLISSHWKEAEVKLVWRYLWLGSVITRTKVNDGKGQKQRGFCMHSHVSEMKSLQIPNYTMEFFCDAAEYASFLHQNVEEAELVEDDLTESRFEQEIEVNAPSSQIAVDLTAMVMDTATYIPEFSPFSEDTQGSEQSGKLSKKPFSPSLQESKRSLAIKGFAGHLSKRFDGASPDDFLKDFWAVKAQYGANIGLHTNHATFNSAHTSQAFSTCAESRRRYSNRRSDGEVVKLSKWLLSTLDTIGRNGATLGELEARFKSMHAGRECDTAMLHKAVDAAVNKRRCFEVNGSDSVRLVSATHASMWTLNPFRIGDDSTKDKVHFVFEKDRAIVSKPWLHLDGSVNATIALMFKRRVVNIVLCSPGIPDHSIHQKMHRALTLQDTRSLLDELLEEDLIYARASRSTLRTRKPQSIFDVAKREPSEIPVFSWSPGRLRAVDNDRDQLFYFPSVNCIEMLGAAASDADIERSE